MAILKEEFQLKKDDQQKLLVVTADKTWETFKRKDALKKAGFEWKGQIRSWTIGYDKVEQAAAFLNRYNKKEEISSNLEKLENFVLKSDAPPDKKKELKGRIELYIRDLANATDSSAMSAEIKRFLTFTAKFRRYSIYNQLLIWMHKPTATRVAGKGQWYQKFNRRIVKGAVPIYIWRPETYKLSNKTDPEPEGEEKLKDAIDQGQTFTRFVVALVYDISDTEAIDASGEIPNEPEWWGNDEPNERAEKLSGYAIQVANSVGVKVTNEPASGGERGSSAGGHINLVTNVAGAGKFSTMIHELAHELLHQPNSKFYIGDEDRQDRKLKELQAESASYVVLRHYQIEVQHHPTYIALWKGNKDKIMSNMQTISKASGWMIDKIDAIAEKSEQPDDMDADVPQESYAFESIIKEEMRGILLEHPSRILQLI